MQHDQVGAGCRCVAEKTLRVRHVKAQPHGMEYCLLLPELLALPVLHRGGGEASCAAALLSLLAFSKYMYE